ncbi:high-affinity choline transporter BetT, partial [Glutamicibacter ardleyensis]
MADRHDASEEDENKLQSKVERSQFGVSKKPKNPVAEEFRAPMNSSELSKGPEELTEQRGTKVNWRVFIISSVLILAFSAWAMFA